MWYYVTVTRNGKRYFVVSPAWGKYVLSETKDRQTYLWETEASARDDLRWQHLVQEGDVVKYVRTYRS